MPTEPNVVLVSDDGAERVVFLERAEQNSRQVLSGGDWEENEICCVMGTPGRGSAEATARKLLQLPRPMRRPAR